MRAQRESYTLVDRLTSAKKNKKIKKLLHTWQKIKV